MMAIFKKQYLIIIGLILFLVVVYIFLPKNIKHDQPVVAENVNVTMVTSMGTIELELYKKKMPITVGNFIELAKAGFYDGVKFHRVIPNFMIQAGDPKTKDDTLKAQWGSPGPLPAIKDEFDSSLSNLRGTIAMANTGLPNTGDSQFFINTADNENRPRFDASYPVFGHVTSGMDVVDAISKVPTEGPDRPVTPVVIEKVVVNE